MVVMSDETVNRMISKIDREVELLEIRNDQIAAATGCFSDEIYKRINMLMDRRDSIIWKRGF